MKLYDNIISPALTWSVNNWRRIALIAIGLKAASLIGMQGPVCVALGGYWAAKKIKNFLAEHSPSDLSPIKALKKWKRKSNTKERAQVQTQMQTQVQTQTQAPVQANFNTYDFRPQSINDARQNTESKIRKELFEKLQANPSVTPAPTTARATNGKNPFSQQQRQ